MEAIYQIYEERMNPDDQKTDPFLLNQKTIAQSMNFEEDSTDEKCMME